jgi:hypothetical protein
LLVRLVVELLLLRRRRPFFTAIDYPRIQRNSADPGNLALVLGYDPDCRIIVAVDLETPAAGQVKKSQHVAAGE